MTRSIKIIEVSELTQLQINFDATANIAANTKAWRTVYLFAKAAIANQAIEAVNSGFDISTAIGAQLDILGKYVNALRNVLGVTIATVYFDMNSYDNVSETAHGFAYYSENPTSNILTYVSYLERMYRITDALLRSFIEFRSRVNGLDVTLKDCDDIMFEYFGNDVTITDNSDMTIEYTYAGSDDLLLFQILAISNSLPKPAGVGVTVNLV